VADLCTIRFNIKKFYVLSTECIMCSGISEHTKITTLWNVNSSIIWRRNVYCAERNWFLQYSWVNLRILKDWEVPLCREHDTHTHSHTRTHKIHARIIIWQIFRVTVLLSSPRSYTLLLICLLKMKLESECLSERRNYSRARRVTARIRPSKCWRSHGLC
jgi:hypothetical protein